MQVQNPSQFILSGPFFFRFKRGQLFASYPLDLCCDFNSKGCWILFHTQAMAFFSLRWSRKPAGPAAGWNWARNRRTIQWLVVWRSFFTFIPSLSSFATCHHAEPYGEANFTQFWPALPPWVQSWDPGRCDLQSSRICWSRPLRSSRQQKTNDQGGILWAQKLHTPDIVLIVPLVREPCDSSNFHSMGT